MSRPAGFTIQHWTDDEWSEVERLVALGKTDREIGHEIGRTREAVAKKRQAMFLMRRGELCLA